MVLKLTEKRREELYDELVQRARQRLQRALEPRSAVSRMYPKLKSAADDQPKQGRFQGWSHLSQQKEK